MSPSLGEAARVWARIGLLSFGGLAAQIALLHRDVVETRGWLTERRFLDALSFCMLLPGPEAMQLATYAGWRLHGVRGGLIAGGLFVLPGAVLIATLAALYTAFGDVPVVAALFLGVKAAVLVIVIEALLRLSRRALTSSATRGIAMAAFVALFVFAVPYPVVVLAAALAGLALLPAGPAEAVAAETARTVGASLRTAAAWLALWLALWLAPLGIVALVFPPIFGALAWFFSVLATVSFGGAYAVLAWMTQEGGDGPRLADHVGDARRAGAGRDDAGAADPGDGVRGLSRRASRRAGGAGLALGSGRGGGDALGDVRSVLSVDLRGRALDRRANGAAAPADGAGGGDGGRRGCDREPLALVRAARPVRNGGRGAGRPRHPAVARGGNCRLAQLPDRPRRRLVAASRAQKRAPDPRGQRGARCRCIGLLTGATTLSEAPGGATVRNPAKAG